MADGPGNYVIESDETNNRQSLSQTINMIYPDLLLRDISITPASGMIVGEDPVTVTLKLQNSGCEISDDSIEIAFYADRTYLGTVTKNSIDAHVSIPVSFIWNKPAAGSKTITAVVNEQKNIVESNLANNDISADFTGTITTNLPGMRIMNIVSTDEAMGDVSLGETVKTIITIKNDGLAAVEREFSVKLYANGIIKSESKLTTVINPGQTIDVIMPVWTADLLPSGTYTLTAYVDSEMKMRLADRNNATAKAFLPIIGGYGITADPIDAITPDGTASLRISLRHTDRNWLPVEDAAVIYKIYSGAGLTAEPSGAAEAVGTMAYNENLGKYIVRHSFTDLTAGEYTVFFKASSPDGLTTLAEATEALKCSSDFDIAVDTRNTANTIISQFTAGEKIIITGNVSGVTQEGTKALISIIGEEEWKIPVSCDGDGDFRYEFMLPADFGGSYSIKASANLNSIVKFSESKVFTVEGIYVGLPAEVSLVQGKSITLEGTIGNIGTMAVSSISIGQPVPVNGGAGITLENVQYSSPGTLDTGQNIAASMQISAAADTQPGTYEYKITTSFTANGLKSREQRIRITVIEAYAEMDAIVLTARETEASPKKNTIAASVRPGEGVSRAVRITNIGTKAVTGFTATSRENLPWISMTTNGVSEILPLQMVFPSVTMAPKR